ncbi:MAG: ribonuclease J [candidate division WWE3 bacterium]|nr:ribonuclease J [candidate division WWE3 bacterium]
METDTTILHLGAFEISFFHTNHSVPESQGVVIKTPVGVIMHVPDYKFDWTPVMGKPFDVQRALKLGGDNVLALLSDCLGATNEGYTVSERGIEDTFDQILDKSEGHQVFITTVASNISRISQAIRSAVKHNRRIVVAGRSLNQNILVAQNMGLLSFPQDVFVPDDKSSKEEQSGILYLVAGAYGQSGSALWRIANGEHKTISIDDGAAVIFSADPIPGVHDQVNAIIDHLTYRGAEVYYSQIQENLHVSGHGSQGDLLMLAGIVKPKYYIPIGGTIHHMRAYRNMIEKMGVTKDRIFEWVEGQTLEFTPGMAKFGKPIETRNVFVDGGQVGEVGSVVIKDRQALSQDGVLVISVPYDKRERRFIDRVQIVSRGFVYVKESQGLMNKVSGLASNVVRRQAPGSDVMAAKNDIEREVGHFLFKETGRNPVVLASIVEI